MSYAFLLVVDSYRVDSLFRFSIFFAFLMICRGFYYANSRVAAVFFLFPRVRRNSSSSIDVLDILESPIVLGPDISGFLLQPFRKPKRIRTAFSPSQLLKLEHAFEKNHYVVGAERKQLAQALSLTETQVSV